MRGVFCCPFVSCCLCGGLEARVRPCAGAGFAFLAATHMRDLTVQLRPIPGITGYVATGDGEIVSVERQVTKSDSRGQPYTATIQSRVLKPWLAGFGYQYVKLGANGPKGAVHRFVCMAFHGEPKNGMEVGHLDGNRLNNRPENLAWVTHSENMKHLQLHGTAPDYGSLRWKKRETSKSNSERLTA